jgi:hypothetical protein
MTPTLSSKPRRSRRSFMDEFRDELVTTILGTAHYLWKAPQHL